MLYNSFFKMPSPFSFLLVIIVLVRYPPSITGNFEKQDAQIFYTGLINALLLKCYPTHYAWLNLSNQVGPNMRKKASLASQKQGEPFTHVKKPKTLFSSPLSLFFFFFQKSIPMPFNNTIPSSWVSFKIFNNFWKHSFVI